MSDRFKRRTFDIAPHAQRYSGTAWATLAFGVMFVICCFALFLQSLLAKQQLDKLQDQAKHAIETRARGDREFAAQQATPAALLKIKAQRQLESSARFSWSGLFEALEIAAIEVRGGVSILGLTPSATQTAGSAEVNVSGLAASSSLMLRYIDVLRTIQPVLSAELVSQQSEERVGTGVVRFSLILSWNSTAVSASSTSDVQPTLQNVAKLPAGAPVGAAEVKGSNSGQ